MYCVYVTLYVEEGGGGKRENTCEGEIEEGKRSTAKNEKQQRESNRFMHES